MVEGPGVASGLATLPDGGCAARFALRNLSRSAHRQTAMTTLAAWIGIDERAPASMYIVSDSRLTLIGGGRSRVLTNQGRKVFACQDEPHVFGFWGQVAFPTRVLTEAVVAIDDGKLFQGSHDAAGRQALFAEYVISHLENQLQ